jgi:hypothetical protein
MFIETGKTLPYLNLFSQGQKAAKAGWRANPVPVIALNWSAQWINADGTRAKKSKPFQPVKRNKQILPQVYR